MKQLLLWLAVLSLLVVPPFAAGSDLDDLKAFSEKGYKAWNSLDAEAIVSMHLPPGAIVMEADSPFPSVQTKENAIASIKAFFSTIEFLKVTPYNVQYKVVGDTGVAWGFYTVNLKPKGGSVLTFYARFTMTAVKSGGKWQMLMVHQSEIPLGD